MEIKGDVPLEYPQEAIWNAFMDPRFVAQVIPGCDALIPAEEPDSYTTDLKIKIGPITGKFKAEVVQYDKVPMDRFSLRIKASGPAGFMDGAGTVELVPDGNHALMKYSGEVNVGGKIARVGQRLIATAARTMISRSLDGFRIRLDEALKERGSTA